MLERDQQSYELPNGAHGTIWRTDGTRTRKRRIHAVIVLDSGQVIREPALGFASWDEAEAWMRKQVEAQNA